LSGWLRAFPGLLGCSMHQHPWGGRQGGGTECLVGVTRMPGCPKPAPCFRSVAWLCFAGTRQLGAAQDVSNAGSCRACAGQATRAWQPARGAISVHKQMERALHLSAPGRRKKIPQGLRTLPCHCSAHFCSTREHPSSSGSWPSQCLSLPSPSAAPRSLHHLAAGPKHLEIQQSHHLLSLCGAAPYVANPQLSILPSERCPLVFQGCKSQFPSIPVYRRSYFIQTGQHQEQFPQEQSSYLGP